MRKDGAIGTAFRNRLMMLQNSTYVSDDKKSDKEQEFNIRNVRIPFDIYGNESTIERQAHLRALDYIYERKKSISGMISSWLTSYCRNPNRPDPEGEGTWINFADVSMEDSIIAPEGINWVICSTSRNAKIELLERLSRPSYPLPIRQKARSSVEPLTQHFPKLNADCIPTAWKDLPVMYFNEKVEPQFTILKKLVSTACSC